MNIYSIPNLLVSVYALILGLVVLRANPRATSNRLCFLLTFMSFFWLFNYGLMYLNDDYNRALIFARLGHASAVILVPIVYWFVLDVLGTHKKKLDVYLAIAASVIALTASAYTYLSPSYFAGISKHYWGYYPAGGLYMLAYTVWTFMVAARALFLLIGASKKAAKELKREDYLKFRYHAVSLIIFTLAAIDYLPKFGLNIYPFGFVFVGAFSSLITYAIARHQILDVQIVIRRSVVYSVLIAFITILYLVIVLLSERFFKSYFGYGSVLNGIIIASIIALTFNPLRVRVQNMIDRHFFRLDPEQLATENVRLKEAVQASDRMKAVATLAAGMAHEIKNPLTAIKTFAEYLPEKSADPEFISRFSKIVSSEVSKIDMIVKQLLEFSKPTPPKFDRLKLVQIVEDTLRLLDAECVKHKIAVTTKFDSDNYLIDGDKQQLQQALLNLFLNAIQAMPSGGILHTTIADDSNGRILLTISDTGHGISKENLVHIFDPFFTTKESGTGLGLAITHGIFQKHKCAITVQSVPGSGTVFNISFRADER